MKQVARWSDIRTDLSRNKNYPGAVVSSWNNAERMKNGEDERLVNVRYRPSYLSSTRLATEMGEENTSNGKVRAENGCHFAF